jgi:CRP/FNR family cyclic AMP-dependent transcriptional regulator
MAHEASLMAEPNRVSQDYLSWDTRQSGESAVRTTDRPSSPFWRSLDVVVRMKLSVTAETRRYGRGERLAGTGARCEEVLIIRSGWAKATGCTLSGHREVTLRLHGPGEPVSDDVAMAGRSSRATVTAITEVHALAVPAAHFVSVISDHPDAARALHRLEEERLYYADQRTVLATADGAVRIAHLLLELCDRYGTLGPDGVTIPIPLTQAEFGTWAGTSRKTVVRALGRMRDDGLIITGRLAITVTDPARLAEHISEGI